MHLAGRGVGKVAFAIEGSLDKGLLVVDLAYGDDAEGAHVGPHDQGLGVGIADHANAEISVEAVQFRFELGAEIAVFDVVNGPLDACFIAHGHAAAAGAEVGMVVGPVIKIRNAVRC